MHNIKHMTQTKLTPEPTTKPINESDNKHSKVGIVWLTMAAFLIVLLLLLIFILQNSQTVHIRYIGAHGHIGFGVAMLLSAVVGAILTLLIGSVRIIQLKLAARHKVATKIH